MPSAPACKVCGELSTYIQCLFSSDESGQSHGLIELPGNSLRDNANTPGGAADEQNGTAGSDAASPKETCNVCKSNIFTAGEDVSEKTAAEKMKREKRKGREDDDDVTAMAQAITQYGVKFRKCTCKGKDTKWAMLWPSEKRPNTQRSFLPLTSIRSQFHRNWKERACNEVQSVPCHPAATDQRGGERMNDDTATRNPATMNFNTTFGVSKCSVQ